MKQCHECEISFETDGKDKSFYKKIQPKIADKFFEIPIPTLCTNCRMQRRMSWRNDRNLYKRKCLETDKDLITMFSEESKIKVIDKDIWWSDQWNGQKYGRNFNFNRTFFEQFSELLKDTPLPHTMNANNENSLYTNYSYMNKNCYLCFAGNYLEDSLYCYNTQNSRDCVDNLFLYDSELCYECIHSSGNYNCKFILNSRNCKESAFLENCQNCSDCFMCRDLNNSQYCFMNEQLNKEEYEKKLSEFNLGDRETLDRTLAYWKEELKLNVKEKDHNNFSENCTGKYILNSKNCHDCYIMGKECEDCRYIVNGFPNLKDSQDCCYSGEKSSLLYECMASGGDCNRLLFCNVCIINSHELFYCNAVFNSKNCFGCTSLRNSEYCILNKQYTKDEYQDLVPKIIQHMQRTGEWGEFFPVNISPFAYNETLAQEFFPLKKEEVLKKKWLWQEEKEVNYSHSTYQGNFNIEMSTEEICKEFFSCEDCQKNYKITVQELKFYKKIQVALPKKCFHCRHLMRLEMRSKMP